MEYLLTGIGGFFGSISRFAIGNIITRRLNSAFPIGTFLINISGAVLLGILTGFKPQDNIYLLFGDGFLGAYTTFSTFMYEGFCLIKVNKKLNAYIYILLSLLLGILGFLTGSAIGSLIRH